MDKAALNGFADQIRKVVREEIQKELRPVNGRLDDMDRSLKKIRDDVPGLVADVISQRFPNLFPHS